MTDNEIREGDQVSWQWSGSRPGGTVAEVATEGKVTMETKSGNEVSKNADSGNPAVYVERSGHDVVKKASELDVEQPGDKHKEDKGDEKTVTKADHSGTSGDKDEKEEEKEDKAEDKEEDKEDEDEDKQADKDDKKGANGEVKVGGKRKAGRSASENKKSNVPKKQKTNGNDEHEPNGEATEPKKKGRPTKSDGPKKETKKREPKRAATESGEPRRSGRNASKSS